MSRFHGFSHFILDRHFNNGPEALYSLVDTFNYNNKGEACNTYSHAKKPVEPKGSDRQTQSASLDDALGVGYGKHACPGRFFALNEVNIFVAHMLMN